MMCATALIDVGWMGDLAPEVISLICLAAMGQSRVEDEESSINECMVFWTIGISTTHYIVHPLRINAAVWRA